MVVALVPQQIDRLLAVLALEMVFADVSTQMVFKTVFAPKHSPIISAILSSVRQRFLVGEVTLWAHARTIVPFFIIIGFLTNFTVVAAAEVSRHCSDEVIVVLAQKDVDFLHSF